MQAGTATVGNCLVLYDAKREIGLKEFVRDVGKGGPQGVTVGAIARGPAWNASEAYLVQLLPFAVLVVA